MAPSLSFKRALDGVPQPAQWIEDQPLAHQVDDQGDEQRGEGDQRGLDLPDPLARAHHLRERHADHDRTVDSSLLFERSGHETERIGAPTRGFHGRDLRGDSAGGQADEVAFRPRGGGGDDRELLLLGFEDGKRPQRWDELLVVHQKLLEFGRGRQGGLVGEVFRDAQRRSARGGESLVIEGVPCEPRADLFDGQGDKGHRDHEEHEEAHAQGEPGSGSARRWRESRRSHEGGASVSESRFVPSDFGMMSRRWG